MNKIQFAKLISYLTALMQKDDCEMLTYEEIERIEQLKDIVGKYWTHSSNQHPQV